MVTSTSANDLLSQDMNSIFKCIMSVISVPVQLLGIDKMCKKFKVKTNST